MTEVIAPPVSVRTNLRGDHWRVGTPLGVEGSLSAPISPCEDLTDRGLTRLWGARSNQTATGSEPASALSQIINAPKVPQKRLLLGLGRSQHHHRHRRPQDPPIIAVTAGYDARPDLSAAASCAENLWLYPHRYDIPTIALPPQRDGTARCHEESERSHIDVGRSSSKARWAT